MTDLSSKSIKSLTETYSGVLTSLVPILILIKLLGEWPILSNCMSTVLMYEYHYHIEHIQKHPDCQVPTSMSQTSSHYKLKLLPVATGLTFEIKKKKEEYENYKQKC